MTARLDYADEREIRWLFAQGVPETAMLEPKPIRTGKVSFKVHLTPLDWLRANRYGVVIVRPDLACAVSRHVPRLAFADAGFARQVKGWMKPPKVTTQFFVEARRVAA